MKKSTNSRKRGKHTGNFLREKTRRESEGGKPRQKTSGVSRTNWARGLLMVWS